MSLGLALFGAVSVSYAVPTFASAAQVTYTAKGAEQQFVVPASVYAVTVSAVGGKGGAGGGAGAFGASVTATIPTLPGQTLYIEVAGNGVDDSSADVFGGGGLGTPNNGSNGSGSGSGGGASDVRLCAIAAPGCALGTTQDSRLVVAGGGGGGGADSDGTGGGGGAAGSSPSGGGTGSATASGSGGTGGNPGGNAGGGTGGPAGNGNNPPASAGGDGSAGQGGAGVALDGGFVSAPGGGGGGGWYGGGGGGGGSRDAQGHVAGGGGGGAGASFAIAQATGVTVTTDTTGTPSVTLTYTPGVPAATVTPSTLAFATQPQTTVGSPQPIAITNIGNAPLDVKGFAFSGANPGDFFIGADDCRSTLAPAASCHASVFFAPQGSGPRSASLLVESNDPAGAETVTLTGTGGALPQGPQGPRGQQGPAGQVELVSCRTVRRTVTKRVHGKPKKVKITSHVCKTKTVSGPVKFTTAISRAVLTRGRVVYATGIAEGAMDHPKIALTTRRKLQAGRYTLTLRWTRGHTTRTTRETITLR